VRDLDDAVARIAAARAAAETAGVPLVINARTDVYFDRAAEAQQNFDAAVARANAYLSAGADCAFVIAVMEADAIARLVAALDGPLNIIAGSAGLDIGALSAMGVRRISLASGLSRVAFGAFAAALAEVREAGTLSFLEGTPTHMDLNALFSKA
jgi:2-methylisocitrate lyase-like PEP mutase family enzyme